MLVYNKAQLGHFWMRTGKGLVLVRGGRHKRQPNRQCRLLCTDNACSGESCVKKANAIAEKLSKEEHTLKAECRDLYQVRIGKTMSSWHFHATYPSNS